MADTTFKDYSRENDLVAGRAIIAGVLVFLLLSLVVARLFLLQVQSHEHFSTLSRDNRVKIEPLPPTRGLIYDANGILLANNYPAYSLQITIEKVDDLEQTIAELGRIVPIEERDHHRFERLLRQRRRFDGVPIRLNLTEEEVARVAVNGHRFPGVDIRAELLRSYPLGRHTAHVLGYVGRINENEMKRIDASDYAGTNFIGKGGVEKAHEETLHGHVGHQQVEVNAKGRVLRVLDSQAPQPGKDLHLYLDILLQQKTTKALDGRRGAVVAIDPRSGGVLAMVSQPSYDPNLFVQGIGEKDYHALLYSKDKPLFNRAVRGQYPPGSTVKPFVGLGGLANNVVSFTSGKWCPGYYQLPGKEHKYRCWKRWGHGTSSLKKAIVQSCDVYFYDLAHDMGIDRLHDFLAHFGFGAKTGVDVVEEAGGLLPSREWKRQARNQVWFPGETLIVGIGQGTFLTTPLQLAAATAAIANRGNYIRPRIVRATEGPDGVTPIERLVHPIPVAQKRHWDAVIASMAEVVESQRGTAKRIRTDAYRIAGKTGTAQVFSVGQKERYKEKEVEERMRDHALFIAFAPVDDPRIAVAVVVENGGHGGSVAAPIARQVMDAYFGYEPQESESEGEG